LKRCGASNKEAGRALGISPRTIEVHRSSVMEKLGARNDADLARIAVRACVFQPGIKASGEALPV